MTAILIANIGTSDITVKIDDYYIPVGFDRNEPNIDESGLTDDEKTVWDAQLRQSYIISELCPELGVTVTENRNGQKSFSFRELTQKLLATYEKDATGTWHDRIRPGRIWGVLQTATQDANFQVKQAYIFVTDQPEFILDKKSGKEKFNLLGYPSDSIHLFNILKKWFQQEMPDLELICKVIPKHIPAVDRDELLNYYYQFFFQHIRSEQTILIGIKGGTPQMQLALTMQAIASSVTSQLFINPQLSVKNILNGKASECDFASYWRYMRSQKYQDVQIILESRWDFRGAICILDKWLATLKFLKPYIDDPKLSASNELLSRIVKTLEVGDYCLNLDCQTAKDFLVNNPQLASKLSKKLVKQVSNYDSLLNLYSQCCIYYNLDQIANFLSRMSSFYEGVLEQTATQIGIDIDFPYLKNRFEKRNFISEKILQRNQASEQQAWQEILLLLKSLDYWCSHRNQLIHHGKGMSKKRMKLLYQEEVKKEHLDTCPPDRIIEHMAKILTSNLEIVKPEYLHQFVRTSTHHYIYSEVKDWAIAQLLHEGLQ
ncbi:MULTISPECIES: hypothetical protein [unclassified Microcoleus]|uniref:hypothetical protein n=1 Tax=unclassified Microcoleus TaxID=2642155 RepID=UPI001DCEC701|nr:MULTISPECIES: hypothetical protein [unclassified Microcoleus]MCC3415737.1 hypothetical protein [Microcoleus sp. PH2017_02_FOX_O_A]MCC3519740.1 hypothetical protein [Microcoleus sp. PH2017_18_LLB_O_A]